MQIFGSKELLLFSTSTLFPGSVYLLILQISSPYWNTLTVLDEPGKHEGSRSPGWTGLLIEGHVMRNSGQESRALELFLLIFSPRLYTEVPSHLLQKTAESIKEIRLTQCLNQKLPTGTTCPFCSKWGLGWGWNGLKHLKEDGMKKVAY